MSIAANLITQACEGIPSVTDGVQALRDCMPQTELRSSFGLTPEKAHAVGSVLTLAAMSMVAVILFLILTGKMSIGGLFRTMTSTRQIDKMYAPKVEKAVEPSTEEPKVTPTEETVAEDGEEITSDTDNPVDDINERYKDVPFGQRPTWLGREETSPEEFFSTYNRTATEEA